MLSLTGIVTSLLVMRSRVRAFEYGKPISIGNFVRQPAPAKVTAFAIAERWASLRIAAAF
jgi:hypothetical protein